MRYLAQRVQVPNICGFWSSKPYPEWLWGPEPVKILGTWTLWVGDSAGKLLLKEKVCAMLTSWEFEDYRDSSFSDSWSRLYRPPGSTIPYPDEDQLLDITRSRMTRSLRQLLLRNARASSKQILLTLGPTEYE